MMIPLKNTFNNLKVYYYSALDKTP